MQLIQHEWASHNAGDVIWLECSRGRSAVSRRVREDSHLRGTGGLHISTCGLPYLELLESQCLKHEHLSYFNNSYRHWSAVGGKHWGKVVEKSSSVGGDGTTMTISSPTFL